MNKPVLYVFLISHYCEKARWALDLAGIDYTIKLLSPVKYTKVAKSLGLSKASVPFLQTDSGVLQGSSAIVNWANEHPESTLLINAQSMAIEKRLDDVLGVHVRRWFYSEALVDCPEIVKPVFAHGQGFVDRILLSLAWPKITNIMIKRMDLGVEQEAESLAIIEQELEWLESMLGDNDYLVDNTFSNADIAAASLIAAVTGPKNHPVSSIMNLSPRVKAVAEQWQSRPFCQWLDKVYQQHR